MSTAGNIVTTEGPVDPDDVGTILPHEHLFIDLAEAWFDQPDSAYERSIAREPVSLENLWYVRRNPLSHEDNGRLESLEEAIEEVGRYARAGGDVMVDVTPKNVGSDPRRVRAVGRETGVRFVHGTAYYTEPAHPDHVADASVDDLAEEFVSDVTEGIDDTTIRAGLVGEIGVSGRIHDQERKVLRAGARAAVETGAPVNVHPPGKTPYASKDYTYPSSRWAQQILDIFEEEGLPPERTVFSHMDRSRFEVSMLDDQRTLADRGAYLEYDLWGTEMYQRKIDSSWPSDEERIDAVMELVDDGYTDRLLFSHDICMKVQRVAYGGFGYGHLLENVVPMLLSRGLEREQIDRIIVENPKQALAFDQPS